MVRPMVRRLVEAMIEPSSKRFLLTNVPFVCFRANQCKTSCESSTRTTSRPLHCIEIMRAGKVENISLLTSASVSLTLLLSGTQMYSLCKNDAQVPLLVSTVHTRMVCLVDVQNWMTSQRRR
jgi:hypothetical protein